MFGTFRLILALLVALSHAGVKVGGLNPGVIAVVCFYLISGYVMTGLLRSHYPLVNRTPYFYWDRALRLFPHYFAIAGLTLLWFYGAGHTTLFLRHPPACLDFIANILVVPLNYFMYNGSDSFTLVPPAWSLGAEIQFYLLMPLLLLYGLRSSAFVVGLIVFAAAAWGLVNTDTFGYRLLPGVLVFFLLGSAVYDAGHKPDSRGLMIVAIGVIGAAIGAALLAYANRLTLLYNRETLLGVSLGLPALYWLARMPQRTWDTHLGDLSYGVFLNHFLIQWALVGQPAGALALIEYIFASLLLSAALQRLIERPVLKWRRDLRRSRMPVALC